MSIFVGSLFAITINKMQGQSSEYKMISQSYVSAWYYTVVIWSQLVTTKSSYFISLDQKTIMSLSNFYK